jgi:hypothetical protein
MARVCDIVEKLQKVEKKRNKWSHLSAELHFLKVDEKTKKTIKNLSKSLIKQIKLYDYPYFPLNLFL